MKKNSFSKLTNEAVLQKYSLMKGVLIGFSILYAIIILVLLYLFFNKNFGQTSVVFFVPVLIFPAMLAPILINYNLLKKEKMARNL